MSTHAEAVRLLELGWSVIPITAGTKKAAIEWKTYQERRATLDELGEWYANGSAAGVAVVTGKVSGLTVVDVDGVDGEATVAGKLPRTVTDRTGYGRHFYFRHPNQSLRNATRFLPGVDLRAEGGYVVCPPSIHPDGSAYAWEPSCSPWELELAPFSPRGS